MKDNGKTFDKAVSVVNNTGKMPDINQSKQFAYSNQLPAVKNKKLNIEKQLVVKQGNKSKTIALKVSHIVNAAKQTNRKSQDLASEQVSTMQLKLFEQTLSVSSTPSTPLLGKQLKPITTTNKTSGSTSGVGNRRFKGSGSIGSTKPKIIVQQLGRSSGENSPITSQNNNNNNNREQQPSIVKETLISKSTSVQDSVERNNHQKLIPGSSNVNFMTISSSPNSRQRVRKLNKGALAFGRAKQHTSLRNIGLINDSETIDKVQKFQHSSMIAEGNNHHAKLNRVGISSTLRPQASNKQNSSIVPIQRERNNESVLDNRPGVAIYFDRDYLENIQVPIPLKTRDNQGKQQKRKNAETAMSNFSKNQLNTLPVFQSYDGEDNSNNHNIVAEKYNFELVGLSPSQKKTRKVILSKTSSKPSKSSNHNYTQLKTQKLELEVIDANQLHRQNANFSEEPLYPTYQNNHHEEDYWKDKQRKSVLLVNQSRQLDQKLDQLDTIIQQQTTTDNAIVKGGHSPLGVFRSNNRRRIQDAGNNFASMPNLKQAVNTNISTVGEHLINQNPKEDNMNQVHLFQSQKNLNAMDDVSVQQQLDTSFLLFPFIGKQQQPRSSRNAMDTAAEVARVTSDRKMVRQNRIEKAHTDNYRGTKEDVVVKEPHQNKDGSTFKINKTTENTRYQNLDAERDNQEQDPFNSSAKEKQQQKQRELFEKLSHMNLSEVIQEQRLRHPELSSLSTEHFTQILIQHIMSLKQINSQQRLQEEQKATKQRSTQPVDGYQPQQKQHQVQSAAQIVNHFNITINHQAGPPIAATPVLNRINDASRLSSTIDATMDKNQAVQKTTKSEFQSVVMARDSVLQSAIQSQQKLQQMEMSNSSVFHIRRKSELINMKEYSGGQESESMNNSHGMGVGGGEEFHIGAMICAKQPRVKRRPALDTNLSRTAPKVLLSSEARRNVQRNYNITEGNSQQNIDEYKRSPTMTAQNLKEKDFISAVPIRPRKESQPSNSHVWSIKNFQESFTKRQPVNVSLKTIINPRVNFNTLTKPNCERMEDANKACLAMRRNMSDSQRPAYDYLNVLIITFDGVLGAFFSSQNTEASSLQTDTLVLRPGLVQALEELLPCYKIVILVGDPSSIRQKAIIKALNKKQVPYDAVYRTIPLANDNLFTYHAILHDLESTKQQVLFLTSSQKTVIKHANPLMDFSLMPLSTGMEQVVIMCLTHILTEAGLSREDEMGKVGYNLDLVTSVCHMTAISDTLISFSNVASNLEKKLSEQTRAKQLKDAAKKDKRIQRKQIRIFQKNQDLDRASPKNSILDRLRSTTDPSKRAGVDPNRRSLKQSDSQAAMKTPSKRFTNFQLLTSLIDNSESLYPLTFFQQKVELQRTSNTFIKAFEKGRQSYDLFNVSYEQPDNFSKLILGKRLQDSVMRLRSKLRKIKQAMRIIAQKESIADERSFRVGQKSYELQRKQPAFLAYQKYNSHYFAEIYEECQVRLPCHPSKEQFDKLLAIYRSLRSRLDNLVNNTFPFSEGSYYNMMVFTNWQEQLQEPLIVWSKTVPRRQFILKDSYLPVTTTFEPLQPVTVIEDPPSLSKPIDTAKPLISNCSDDMVGLQNQVNQLSATAEAQQNLTATEDQNHSFQPNAAASAPSNTISNPSTATMTKTPSKKSDNRVVHDLIAWLSSGPNKLKVEPVQPLQ